MIHRHLDYDPTTVVEGRGAAALDDLLDRGDLADWAPLARALAADPFGELARTVERICDAHPMYGTSPLWRAYLDRCRARAEGPLAIAGAGVGVTLADLRRSCGVTQVEMADRLGMSQSDVSKLERRTDVRLSTLQSYVRALPGRLRLLVDRPGTPPVALRLAEERTASAVAGRGRR